MVDANVFATCIRVKDRSKHEHLIKHLEELSVSQLSSIDDINKYIELFKQIYQSYNGERFRPLYSVINQEVIKIDRSTDKDPEILSDNLKMLLLFHEMDNENPCTEDICFCKGLVKLYDHICLDHGRINYVRHVSNNLSEEHEKKLLDVEKLFLQEIDQARGRIERLSNGIKIDFEKYSTKIENTEQELNKKTEVLASQIVEHDEKLDNSKKEYITILGIFAALVITFVAGIAFSTSVFNNIDKVSVYRLILVVLLLGLIVGNWIAMLIKLVHEVALLNKKEEKGFWKSLLSSRILWYNAIMLIALSGLILFWKLYFIELRNQVGA